VRKLLQLAKSNLVMLVNAGSLVGTTAVTSVLGFAYWWLAARLFPPESVGLASAAISAMMLLGTVGVLGLGTLLTGELPRQPGREWSLISAALIVVGGVGGCIGILFAVVAPLISTDFLPLRASGVDIALFAIGTGLTAVTLVLDQALIGLLRGEIQLWRNTLFASIKLVALFVAGFLLSLITGMTIYTTWLIGNALSLVALIGFIPFNGIKCTYRPQWGMLRKLGPAAVKHHILNLILLAPPLILPILVTIQLSATANAWFYVSFMLANFVFGLTYALSTVLYAESSAQPSVLAHKARFTLGLAIVTSIVANCVLQLGAKQLLGLFGHTYAEQAVWCLRILSLGAFPLIVKSHYIAICRIHDRIANAVLPITIGTLMEVGGAALGAHLSGLSGLSLGWLAAISFEAVYMSRTVFRAARPMETTAGNRQLESSTLYHDGMNLTEIPTNEPSFER
jgi:O-antigen/teichoic acid export membrane protein